MVELISFFLFLVFCSFMFWLMVRFFYQSSSHLWTSVLNKYPKKKDICRKVLLDSLDTFSVGEIVIGRGYRTVARCPILFGDHGLHIIDKELNIVAVGCEINGEFPFISWDLLVIRGECCNVYILNSNDVLCFTGEGFIRFYEGYKCIDNK